MTLLSFVQVPTGANAIGYGALTGGVTYTPSLTAANATRDVSYAFAIAGVETSVGLLSLDCHLDGSSFGNLVSGNASAVGTCVDVFGGWSAPCAALVSRAGLFGPLAMSCLTPWGGVQISGALEFVPLTAPSVGAFVLIGQVASQ